VSFAFKEYSNLTIVECADFLSVLPDLVQTGKILLVTSPGFVKRGLVTKIINRCGAQRIFVFDGVTPNPEKEYLQANAAKYIDSSIRHVIALGGGSVIDASKVFCALLSYPKSSLDDLLSVQQVENSINLIAIPTTSGTGAEVTPFATVWQSNIAKKYSLYGVRPDVALLDGSLTLSLPYEETLYPALDALSHALESLWNKNKTEASERSAKQAISLLCQSLPKVLVEPGDLDARRDLQRGATLAGIAISMTRTAIAHALSYPLTAGYAVPHGLACSFTLSAIIEVIGCKKLGLSEALSEQVRTLLAQLNFGCELDKYITWPDIQQLANIPMDASRAGNFIANADNKLVQKILLTSERLTKQATVL
jgi:alcohol dehydrogenase